LRNCINFNDICQTEKNVLGSETLSFYNNHLLRDLAYIENERKEHSFKPPLEGLGVTTEEAEISLCN
jgi:hypothetical protein